MSPKLVALPFIHGTMQLLCALFMFNLTATSLILCVEIKFFLSPSPTVISTMAFQASVTQSLKRRKKNKLKIPFSSVECDCTRFKWRKNSFLLKNFQKCYKLVKRIGKRSIYDLKPPFHSGDFEHFQTKIVNCNFNCFFYGEEINVCISSCDQKHIILCKQTAF